MNLIENPLVSICCPTYNHENYIQEAIESFLNQKVAFPIEIIIHDDASTDNTANIIKSYSDRYPDLFNVIVQSENKYSKSIINFWSEFIFPVARGKYIAICEGDDYWIDPFKLQKQVDFLENNKEYGLVHGDCHYYYQGNGQWFRNANSKLINNTGCLSGVQIFEGLIGGEYKIRTATAMFKKELLKLRFIDPVEFEMGDTPLWLDLSQITKFKYFDEIFSVYRVLENSASRSTNKKNHYKFFLSMYEMRVFYSFKYSYPINQELKNRYNVALLSYKIFDQEYRGLYPLFDPTAYQQFIYRLLHACFMKKFILRNIFFQKFILYKLILNQL